MDVIVLKKLVLTILLALTLLLTISAAYSSNINITDSNTINLIDDSQIDSVEFSDFSNYNSSKISLSNENVLKYSNSNNVSTDSENNFNLTNNNEDILSDSKSTELVSPTTNIYYKGSLNVTLKDSEGKSVVGQTVKFIINNKNYSAKTNQNGIASVSLSLNPGKYTATINYEGNDDYSATNLSATVNVLGTIATNDISKYYKGCTYTATFYTSQGEVLANTNVKIKLNGKTYTKKTNAKGVASLAVSLKPGTYKVTATDPITGYSISNTVKILSTISASDITKIYKDNRKFTATFLKSNGKPLAKTNIKFKVNGKTYTQKTNTNGKATLSLTTLPVGTYKIISYNTDGLTKTNTIKVVKTAKTTLTATNYEYLTTETKTIKATLKNQYGYAPNSGKIIKFTVNGKTYSSKTNTNGVASIKLPTLKTGTYTIKYKFAGNSLYKASSTTSKLTILPTKTPTYTIKSSTTLPANTESTFKLALTSGTVPLEKRTITLTVAGETYTKTTDSNGIISLPINLNVGKYTITYSNKADTKINAKSGSATLTVKEVLNTTLTWKSEDTFTSNAQTYKIELLDSNNKAISDETVKLIVNSKTYSAKTTSDGYATFNTNLAKGQYTASYSFAGNSIYAPSSGSVKITIDKNNDTGYGYWVYGADMNTVNLNTLAAQGTTDILLNYYAITKHGQSAVETWIANANKLNIRVHIWMQVFYSSSTGWVNPIQNGAKNTDYFTEKITEAQKYAKIKGVSGIHLDYMRYPGTAYKTNGGTAAISSFVKEITTAIHNINPKLIVSTTLMPETENNAYYYGQDYSVISKYMDVVIPMIYKGNYEASSLWITTTAKWFVDNSKGAQVWAGIQGYNSDNNPTNLTVSELKDDAKAAINGKAGGVIIFRYGNTNLINFDSLDDDMTTESVSMTDVINAANTLHDIIDSEKEIPTSVSVDGINYPTAQYLYLMTKTVENINSGKTSKIFPVTVISPAYPIGNSDKGNLTKAQYVDLASRVSNFIYTNNRAPNYASSILGDIQYELLVDSFSRILTFYKTNARLPNSVFINDTYIENQNSDDADPTSNTNETSTITNNTDTTSNTNETSTVTNSTETPNENITNTTENNTNTTNQYSLEKNIGIKNIVDFAEVLQDYYSNNKMPSDITLNNLTFTTPELLYLMSKAIIQIENLNTEDIEILYDIQTPKSPDSSLINTDELSKENYLLIANNLINYMKANKQAPNYASSAIGDIGYYSLVDAFSRILIYYKTNSQMPNIVYIEKNPKIDESTINSISIENVITGAKYMQEYYESYKQLPSNIKIGEYSFTTPELLYAMSQAVYQIGNSNFNNITLIYNVDHPSSPYGDIIDSKELSKTDYLKLAQIVVNFINNNKKAPNYASSTIGNIIYSEIVDVFSRILVFYSENARLPNYVIVNYGYDSASGSLSSTGTGLNDINVNTDLSKYLKASTNCEVGNEKIKSLVNSLTENLTSDLDKATAIFNYVLNNIQYSFYSNTKYGAVGTLNSKQGNCVDHSHLLIAMFRTANIPARYVHGTCTFTSGNTYGHVWVQVLIGNNWVVADATSSKNSLGNINNWDTGKFTFKGIYSSLSF